jgi:hypothetical protein
MSSNLVKKLIVTNTAILVLSLLLGLGKAYATPIIYIFSATGSGKLGTNAFSDVPFTITCTANTSQITNPTNGLFNVADRTATISISGLGLATFTNPTLNVDNQIPSLVGFSDPTQDRAILFVNNPAFGTYNLGTPLGPLTGPPTFNFDTPFATTSGNFSLSSVSTVSFESLTIPPPNILYYSYSQTTNTLIATNCISGAVYTVEGNTNLMTTNWMALESVAAGGTSITNGVASFSLTTTSNTPSIFFRVYH